VLAVSLLLLVVASLAQVLGLLLSMSTGAVRAACFVNAEYSTVASCQRASSGTAAVCVGCSAARDATVF
jgi:hypothetical protein